MKLLEREEAKENPLSLIEDKFLWIKTKGTLTEPPVCRPLILNKAQERVLSIIKLCLVKGKPIRLIILKARQLGISTLIEAIIYSYTSQQENLNALIVADDADGADYLFEMSKLYQEKMVPHLKPLEKKSNAKKLEFEHIHSQILIDTAENKDAGRKYTFRLVHLSEYALYPYPDEIMLGISHAVPALPGTMIIKESTANGFNHFKNEWDAAVNKETDYIPIFIPWYWGEDYRMSADNLQIGDPTLGEISRLEPQLATQMRSEGIDFIEERLAWRRWDIRNNCKGSVAKFQQENPSNPDEAFIASGDCAFDKEELVRQLKLNKKPIAIGNIIQDDYGWKFRTDPQGDFKFFEAIKPRSQEEYIIAGDACSGSGQDYAVLVALGKRTNSILATYHVKVDSDILADKAMRLANLLHNAEVAIENNSYGFHANLKLRSIYGNVYRQEKVDSDSGQISETYGWNTNQKTRADCLGELKEDIRNKAITLNDETIIRECLTFVKNKDSGKEEAINGCHDDMVISLAIASSVRRRRPFVPVEKPVHAANKRIIPDY